METKLKNSVYSAQWWPQHSACYRKSCNTACCLLEPPADPSPYLILSCPASGAVHAQDEARNAVPGHVLEKLILNRAQFGACACTLLLVSGWRVFLAMECGMLAFY